MARIRSVHPGQWTDAEFLQCSAFCRLLVLALRNDADDNGIFKWNPAEMKIKLMPLDNVNVPELLAEAVQNNQIMKFEANGKEWGMLRNFAKYQKPKSPTFQYPIPSELPNGYELNPSAFGNAGELFPEAFGNSRPDGEEGRGEKGRGGEGSKSGNPSRSRFKKPTIKEITEYVKTIGATNVNPATFFNHYEANGWRVGGKTTMVDWKAAVRGWESRGKDNH